VGVCVFFIPAEMFVELSSFRGGSTHESHVASWIKMSIESWSVSVLREDTELVDGQTGAGPVIPERHTSHTLKPSEATLTSEILGYTK